MRFVAISAAVAALALGIAVTQSHFEPARSSAKSASAGLNVYAATTIRVPTDYRTIQAAISAASNGDTIVVSPGTYAEHINFLGKAITVQSAQGPGGTVIDGG